jgi:hypothetical protein
MRQTAISTDRFLIFARKVSGNLGEDVSEILAGGDAEMEHAQRELAKYRKQLADRTLSFQTNLVSNVLNAIVRSSKLQLDFGGKDKGIDSSLVVVNTELKETVQKLLSGDSSRGFFDAGTQVQNLLNADPEHLTVANMLKELMGVGINYHEKLASQLVNQPGTRVSLETLMKPHNLFAVRYKADFYTAVGTAFTSVEQALQEHFAGDRAPWGTRSVTLWELCEGDYLPLTQAFAAYVAMALQWMRNQASNRSIYVSKFAQDSNYVAAKSVRRRLVHVVCDYLDRHPDRPRFLAAGGREAYYGGRPDTEASSRQTPCDGTVEYPQLPQGRPEGPPAKRPKGPADGPAGSLDAQLARQKEKKLQARIAKYKRITRRLYKDAFSNGNYTVMRGGTIVPSVSQPTTDQTAAFEEVFNKAFKALTQEQKAAWVLSFLEMLVTAAASEEQSGNVEDKPPIEFPNPIANAFCQQYNKKTEKLTDNILRYELPDVKDSKHVVSFDTTEVRFDVDINVSAALCEVFMMDPLYAWKRTGNSNEWTRPTNAQIQAADNELRSKLQSQAKFFMNVYNFVRGSVPKVSTQAVAMLCAMLIAGVGGVKLLTAQPEALVEEVIQLGVQQPSINQLLKFVGLTLTAVGGSWKFVDRRKV